MAKILVISTIGVPLLASLALAVASRRARPSVAHHTTLAVTGLATLLALALLPFAGGGTVIAVEWFPSMGQMGLTPSPTGLYAVLATAGAAFFTLLATAAHAHEFPPLTGALMLLALAATTVAFLTDHFLARYVVLEIVALCIALAVLVEIQTRRGVRLAGGNYLLLRLGDVGMLTGILLLMDVSGTLQISPALEQALATIGVAGGTPVGMRLRWAVAGFLLAVWVKLGGWPFQLWKRGGLQLALASQIWLYATVMPSLGIYLLYRVTPLLALAGHVHEVALWIGSGGALLAGLTALRQQNLRVTLIYQEAVQAGLLLFVAASGVKEAIWLSLFVMMPLRLLLFLAADIAQPTASARQRKIGTSLLTLGGIALVLFNLLITWWAGRTGVRLDALFVAQAAVALTGVLSARVVWQSLKSEEETGPRRSYEIPWARKMTMGLLGFGIVGGGMAFGPLAQHLMAITSTTPPDVPTLPTLLRHTVTSPAILLVVGLTLIARKLWQWTIQIPTPAAESTEEMYNLEEGLVRAARALRAVVEVGMLEEFIVLIALGAVEGARFTYRVVEQEGLEGLVALFARGAIDGARLTYRVVEQEGLEGLLRRAVQWVLALGRGLQRWHTGRLRHNLLWMAISLALAVLTFVLYGG
ncbi:MAG: proton-conducting transporter membrane subunit [Chloroflexota bacterium]|nr:proton-conducting transporter membrane subunit [Chloroflexota bacterium]